MRLMNPVILRTADALHTQWKFARYIVEKRNAHYHFTVKEIQAGLLNDISCYFQDITDKKEPEAIDISPGDHGRIEMESERYGLPVS